MIAPGEPPVPDDGFAPGRRERAIERSASLTLAAPADRLDRVADRIATITDRYDGFVLRSSLGTGDEEATGGSFELRIPEPASSPRCATSPGSATFARAPNRART